MRHRVKNAPDLYRGTMVYPERERKVIRVKSVSFLLLCRDGAKALEGLLAN